jgi:hypothetical protein
MDESALTPQCWPDSKEIAEARRQGWRGRLLELNGKADQSSLLIVLDLSIFHLSIFVHNLNTGSRLLRKEFIDKFKRVYRGPSFGAGGGAPSSS